MQPFVGHGSAAPTVSCAEAGHRPSAADRTRLPRPEALAAFYGAITGWPVGHRDDDWVQLDAGGAATLAFQLVLDTAGRPFCLVAPSA